ncbi:multinuclear nonheme iron-dependent oxidase, partial [Roseateles sp. GG27B]
MPRVDQLIHHAANYSPSTGALGKLPGLPKRAGVGLKPQHFREVLAVRPDIGFFEVHAENYMVDGGPFHHFLTRIREHYPLSLHGVGLSIG